MKVGLALQAQDKLEDALKAYHDSLAIMERLAAADSSNTLWRHNLAGLYDEIGNVLLRQGKPEEALKTFRDGLAIMERLAAADPSDTRWQRGLSVYYNKVGDVFRAQGKLAEALQAHHDSLAIMERLAATDPSNTVWQRDLSVCYNKIGNVLVQQGQLEEALKAYRDSLAIMERLVAADRSNMEWERDLQIFVSGIGGIAYRFVLDRNFAIALECADQAISLAPAQIWFYSNRAHALMFLGRDDEARAIYLRYRGEQHASADKSKSWEAAVLDDFAELRQAKLTHPLMDEIEALFASRH
jgi:tetratricopeptide (TPR) repeat protein